ncbi:hypothetical protein E3N88_32555 [Mikania micrantha]|uniref:Uncharacterized protein n=1 Tax=Mikania micrantha TaxID=192012 RepID=A0A5N6M8Q8_9ASTR|nr:hypothetical protein E3N88_32555 [Mikania micrantha]
MVAAVFLTVAIGSTVVGSLLLLGVLRGSHGGGELTPAVVFVVVATGLTTVAWGCSVEAMAVVVSIASG